MPRSQSISPRSIGSTLQQHHRTGTLSKLVEYAEFEHELLHTNWSQRLKHVDKEELERQKRFRSPSLSPLKAELLTFDHQRLRNPLYEQKWKNTVAVESVTTTSGDSTARLIILADFNSKTTDLGVQLNAMQSAASSQATIYQRVIKYATVKAEILMIQGDSESTTESDNTTMRMQSTDGWADDDEEEAQGLTEHYRNISDLELEIHALQREMGLLTPMTETVEFKKSELNSKQPFQAHSTSRSHESEVKSRKSEKRPSKMILKKEQTPLLERWVIEKKPEIRWTVTEQARESQKSKMMMTSKEIEAIEEATGDVKQEEEVEQMPESNLIPDHQELTNLQTFLIKSKAVKKKRNQETIPLKTGTESSIEEVQHQSLKDEKEYHGPVHDCEDSVEKTATVTIQSYQVPLVPKHRSESTDKNEVLLDMTAKEVQNAEENHLNSFDIDPAVWLEVQQQFGSLSLETQHQLAKFMMDKKVSSTSVENSDSIDTFQEQQSKSGQRLPFPIDYHASPKQSVPSKHSEGSFEISSQKSVKEVNRLLLTQALLTGMKDAEGIGGEEEHKEKKSIGEMMKRLLIPKKKKKSTEEKPRRTSESPSLSTHSGHPQSTGVPEKLHQEGVKNNVEWFHSHGQNISNLYPKETDGRESLTAVRRGQPIKSEEVSSVGSQVFSAKEANPNSMFAPVVKDQHHKEREQSFSSAQEESIKLPRPNKEAAGNLRRRTLKLVAPSLPQSQANFQPQMGVVDYLVAQQILAPSKDLKLPEGGGSISSRDSSEVSKYVFQGFVEHARKENEQESDALYPEVPSNIVNQPTFQQHSHPILHHQLVHNSCRQSTTNTYSTARSHSLKVCLKRICTHSSETASNKRVPGSSSKSSSPKESQKAPGTESTFQKSLRRCTFLSEWSLVDV